MIPILNLSVATERERVEALLRELRLKPQELVARTDAVNDVEKILANVAKRGDEAIVESSRKFDDPNFSADQIRVTTEEMRDAAKRVSPEIVAALKRSIAQ